MDAALIDWYHTSNSRASLEVTLSRQNKYKIGCFMYFISSNPQNHLLKQVLQRCWIDGSSDQLIDFTIFTTVRQNASKECWICSCTHIYLPLLATFSTFCYFLLQPLGLRVEGMAGLLLRLDFYIKMDFIFDISGQTHLSSPLFQTRNPS